MSVPSRYVPLRSYAAIGDGRTIALVADNGAIDWLALPNLDSGSVFGALLDSRTGGSFTLAPTVPTRVSRRYVPNTNVLETTFTTSNGTVQVVDAMTLQGGGLSPFRELQRRIEGVSGLVRMAWQVRPRFGYGSGRTRMAVWLGVPIATCGTDAIAVCTYPRLPATIHGDAIAGEFEVAAGSRVTIALSAAHAEPLVFPSLADIEERFARTVATWEQWSRARRFDGPWRDAVARSALALKLLVFAPSGALAAAATTSLPEEIGGVRNWDYRFCWVRDSAFTLDALLRLGCAPEAEAYFWWLLHASQLTHPRLQPLYRLDGGARMRERSLDMAGYEGSRPVRVGNAASDQLQLDAYGELLQTAWLYARAHGGLDADIGRRLTDTADLICELWRLPDAGIWEVRSKPVHFTHSKMMCWVGLSRAMQLADNGFIPGRHRDRWAAEAAAIRDFVETRCYSEDRGAYVRFAGTTELDASVLLGLLSGYGDPRALRWSKTVDAVRQGLGRGPYLLRYSGEDGLPGGEGAFISCSFWLAEALARVGRVEDAATLMDQLVTLGNDVGLYAEEINPGTGAFLGNFPQGLSHLSLISAATTIAAEAAK